MTFTTVSPGRACPSCRTPDAAQVIESRATKLGRRRRHSCNACGHRFTTHEIDQHTLEQLQADALALAKIRQALGNIPDTFPDPHTHATDAFPCETCTHGQNNTCTLTLPEAFTPQSIDCAYFRA